MRTPLRALPVLALVALLGCPNAGEDRLLTVGGTGVVKGYVIFDVNGNRTFDAGDDSVKGIRIRLLTTSTHDSVAAGVSLPSGIFRIEPVPVGTYLVVVDTTPLTDTALVAHLDSAQVTIRPADSNVVNVLIGYPHVSIAAARAMPLGRRVFIEGIALNSPTSFRDTTMHVQDTSAAIRLTRIRTAPSAPGDSIRARGTTNQRNGQRTLDDVSTFFVAPSFLPPAESLSTLAAAGAAPNGTRDARFVRIAGATITDTTYLGSTTTYVLTVTDGSGSLQVLLDGTADVGFRRPGPPTNGNFPDCAPTGQCVPGNVFSVFGLLVPSAVNGVWQLKPRSSQDLVKQ